MADKSKIAVFVDVENLTHWVKEDGAERLMADLGTIGQVIVRRAYGVWSKPHLTNFQAPLNRLGFELIHSYHPVSGKNSADIQLTVDVMEHALRLRDVDWFVLATGDSDFSPLFRRLREMGKEVIGVGPRSPLSESVKSSCSRYIHTDLALDSTRALEFDDAADIVEKILSTQSEPMMLTALKAAILNVDSAFDEKAMGFNSFSAFLRAMDTVSLNLQAGSTTLWLAEVVAEPETGRAQIGVSTERYQTLLRKKKWRSVPLSLLTTVEGCLRRMPPMEWQEMGEWLVISMTGRTKGVTITDVKKAFTIFSKAQLFDCKGEGANGERIWEYRSEPNYLQKIDCAILARIKGGCDDAELVFDPAVAAPLLYGSYSPRQLAQMGSAACTKEENESTPYRGAGLATA